MSLRKCFRIKSGKLNTNTISGAALAYLGDAVFELIVRRRLLETGVTDTGRLNKMASRYVRATEQSKAVVLIEPHLSEKESAIYRRGRNANGISIPHSASAVEYRRATGLEALFAHLYLQGAYERLDILFDIGFPFEATEKDECQPKK